MSPSDERISRYELQEIIGRGAMGVVYLAHDPVIGRVVALKTIQIPDGTSPVVRGDSMERFAREAKAAGVLSHPNIVTIYDVGELEGDEGASYIAMEFVEGRTLRQMVPHGERIDFPRILDVAMQVARALDYAHRRGIVHRDVKPANILVRDDGLVKLADFGVARIDSSDLTRTGQSVGSPSYIAPEMLLDQPVDGRSDLFSLGVIVYELLTGVKPFRGETLAALYHQILSGSPPPPSRINPEAPPAWDAVTGKLLAKRPGDRYESAAHLLEDLRALESGRQPRFCLQGEAPPDLAELAAASPLAELIPDRVIEDGINGPSPRPRRIAAGGKALVALATVAGFGFAIIAGTFLLGRPEDPPEPMAAEGVALLEPAGLTLKLEHNLKSGRVMVTMDGKPILKASFRGERERMRIQGDFARGVKIPAGRHAFKVTVSDDEGRSWSGSVTRGVDPGSKATLLVEVKGLLKKNLELSWNQAGS